MRGCDPPRIKVPLFFLFFPPLLLLRHSLFHIDSPRSDSPLSVVGLGNPLLRTHLIVCHFVLFRQAEGGEESASCL